MNETKVNQVWFNTCIKNVNALHIKPEENIEFLDIAIEEHEYSPILENRKKISDVIQHRYSDHIQRGHEVLNDKRFHACTKINDSLKHLQAALPYISRYENYGMQPDFRRDMTMDAKALSEVITLTIIDSTQSLMEQQAKTIDDFVDREDSTIGVSVRQVLGQPLDTAKGRLDLIRAVYKYGHLF